MYSLFLFQLPYQVTSKIDKLHMLFLNYVPFLDVCYRYQCMLFSRKFITCGTVSTLSHIHTLVPWVIMSLMTFYIFLVLSFDFIPYPSFSFRYLYTNYLQSNQYLVCLYHLSFRVCFAFFFMIMSCLLSGFCYWPVF